MRHSPVGSQCTAQPGQFARPGPSVTALAHPPHAVARRGREAVCPSRRPALAFRPDHVRSAQPQPRPRARDSSLMHRSALCLGRHGGLAAERDATHGSGVRTVSCTRCMRSAHVVLAWCSRCGAAHAGFSGGADCAVCQMPHVSMPCRRRARREQAARASGEVGVLTSLLLLCAGCAPSALHGACPCMATICRDVP